MTETEWIKYAEQHLKGRSIIAVRYMTKKETETMGWYKRPLVIELDDGAILFPSQDDEGNDGGALFGQNKTGELTFPVLSMRD